MSEATEELQHFVDTSIAKHGYRRTGAIEQIFVRPWSTIWRLPAGHTHLYLKVSDPATAYEPALTQELARLAPRYIPAVLAIDIRHGWLLTEDAGIMIREILAERNDPALPAEAVTDFAQLQICILARLDLLIAAGCPDWRLERLPALYELLLSDNDALLLEQPGGVSQAELVEMRAFTPAVAEMCRRLASYAIPQSIHHDDLNGSNTMHNGNGFRFIDWAEACLAHPFCSLMIFLRVMRFIYKYDEHQLAGLRDLYLQQWSAYGTQHQLLGAFTLAQRLAKLYRALTWRNVVVSMPPEERREYQERPAYFLKLFFYDADDIDE